MTTSSVSSAITTKTNTRSPAKPNHLKLTCHQNDLVRALSLVGRAMLAQSTQPILSTFLLTTDTGRLCLSATNLEIGIRVEIDASIETAGMMALPARLFTQMISQKPYEQITLVAPSPQVLRIQRDASISHLRCVHDPCEFPAIPDTRAEKFAHSCEVEARLLKKMIRVSFAADTVGDRTVFTAVYLRIADGTITLAAANSFHLAEWVAHLKGTPNIGPLLIPARNLEELGHLLPSQGTVTVVVPSGERLVGFYCEQERFHFISSLLEGTYPDYQNVIPGAFPTRTIVDREAFEAALFSASAVSPHRLAPMRMTVKEADEETSTPGTLTIEAADPDLGDHRSCLLAEVSGPTCQVIFPGRSFIKALELIESPQVIFSLIGPGRPAVLKPQADVQYRALVMPIVEK